MFKFYIKCWRFYITVRSNGTTARCKPINNSNWDNWSCHGCDEENFLLLLRNVHVILIDYTTSYSKTRLSSLNPKL
jgi:hypothetical protein